MSGLQELFNSLCHLYILLYIPCLHKRGLQLKEIKDLLKGATRVAEWGFTPKSDAKFHSQITCLRR